MEKTNQGFAATTVMVNGQSANLFVADLNEGQILSVVSTSLLQRLTNLLPLTDVATIIHEFCEKLMELETSNTRSVEAFVIMLQEELDFHKSINLINKFFIDMKESGSLQPVVA